MKVAISSVGNNINSDVSSVFGRCPYFIIVEIEDGKIEKTEVIENKAANKGGGAGISAAQSVAEKKAEEVITCNIGPNALNVLNQFKIVIYIADGPIKGAIQNLIDGKLKKFE